MGKRKETNVGSTAESINTPIRRITINYMKGRFRIMGILDDLLDVLEDVGELVTDAGEAIIDGAETLTMQALDKLEEEVESGEILKRIDPTKRDSGDILYHD